MKEVKSTHVGAYGFIIKDDCIALIKKHKIRANLMLK